MPRQYRIASIPADGIGPEVISAGLEVLDAVAARDGGFKLIIDHYDWGSNWYRKHGEFMPADGLAWLRTADAIYFGAVGDPDIPDHITLWGLRLPICQGLDQYANVRPTRILPGITSPLRDVRARRPRLGDRAREQRGRIRRPWRTRASRPARGGRHRDRHLHPPRRRADHALRLRHRAQRGRASCSPSSPSRMRSATAWCSGTRSPAWCRTTIRDVTWDKELVDAMTMRMVRKPQTIDTVVATNLHADILSDLAAALAGSLGIAPTGNVDPERRSPSMFEPIHGSAFDITGKGIANPVASFWTGAMMLEHLGEKPAADLLMRAVEQVCAAGDHDTRSRRQGNDSGGDARGVRGGARHEPLMDEAILLRAQAVDGPWLSRRSPNAPPRPTPPATCRRRRLPTSTAPASCASSSHAASAACSSASRCSPASSRS